MPLTIISGGQSGADIAGLDFAIANGLKHGGYCPRGRKNENGVIPIQYKLTELDSDDYKVRTARNVARADVTVIFNAGDALSAGSGCTINAAKRSQKPTLILRSLDLKAGRASVEASAYTLVTFCADHRPTTLNVAGNRESNSEGIGNYVSAVLVRAYELAKTLTPEAIAKTQLATDPYAGLDLFGEAGPKRSR